MSRAAAPSKSGRASLIGGAAVAVASLILWIAVTRELGAFTPAWLVLGLVISGGIGAWIRIADL
jgi:uncharacterized membrane-anchored protein